MIKIMLQLKNNYANIYFIFKKKINFDLIFNKLFTFRVAVC